MNTENFIKQVNIHSNEYFGISLAHYAGDDIIIEKQKGTGPKMTAHILGKKFGLHYLDTHDMVTA